MLPFVMKFILYGTVLLGLWTAVKPLIDVSLKNMAKRMDNRMRLKARVWEEKTNQWSRNYKLYTHIDNLLYIAEREYEQGTSVIRFYTRSILLFLSLFAISYSLIGYLPKNLTFENPFTQGIQADQIGSGLTWQFPFVFSLVMSLIPYFRLRYRYSMRKVKATYDLLEVVQVFTKFSDLSIDAALGHAANLISGDNVLKQPIRILSETFSTYGSEQELRREVQRFNKTIDTTFALQFTSDLLYAEREGNHHLRDSVLRLKEDMELQRTSILDVRSNSRDAIQMGIWGNLLVLVLCCGSIAMFVKPSVYMKLQFQTKTGLTFSVLIFVLLFISFLISYTLARPKLDYK